MHDYTPDPSHFIETIPLIDDSDEPDAENFAVTNEALADNVAYVRLVAASNACSNFLAPVATVTDAGSNATHLVAACWQPVTQDWVGMFAEQPFGTSGLVYTGTTHCSGIPWTLGGLGTGGISLGILAACASSADMGTVFVSLKDPTGTNIVHNATTTTQPFLNTLATATVVFTPSGYLLFGTEQSGGTFTGHAASSTDGSGVWTDLSSSLPSGWATGAHAIEASYSATNGKALTNPRAVLVAFSTLSSSFSQLLANDGSGGFVDVTPAFVGTGLGSIFGLAWNAGLKLWGLTVLPPGSVGGTFYTSADGLTWTLQHTFPVGIGPSSIAAVGFTWFVRISGLPVRMLCTPDNGASWTTVSCSVAADNLASSGNQLLAWKATTSHAFSLQAGFMSGGQY